MHKRIKVAGLWMLAGLGWGISVQAVAAPSLLSAQDVAQLTGWLGQGPVALNNIYSKASGDTALEFHRAVDGMGRTFSVMEASNAAGQTWLVGGYNPQSWSSTDGLHVTMADSERTAFLFNLTSGQVLPQLKQYFSGDGIGSGQTYNDASYGPTFGVGHDLYVPFDLTNGGYSALYTYNRAGQPANGVSLVDGSANFSSTVTFGALQVYSVSAVPEPATYALLLAGLALLAVRARARRSLPPAA